MTSDALTKAKLELVRLRQEYQSKLRLAYDAENIDSRPTPAQEQILKDDAHKIHWIIAGNRSGKSQLGARVVSWWFNNDHPFQERPEEWGTAPLQILVIGRVGEQIESELWAKKIKPFLKPGTYKEVRTGNALQRVINLENDNRIIFMSHHGAGEAREKVQAFTANVVWLDEMPDDSGLVSELLMRTLTSNGYLYATFTPLLRNEAIRKIVDSKDNPRAIKHKFSIVDNPIFKGREQEILAEIRAQSASEAEYRARAFGDWFEGDLRVFSYNSDAHRRPIPESYDRVWRHIAITDPSASGLTGLTLWAEDPQTGIWYCVKAKYLNGQAAYDLLDNVEREIAGHNVVMRVCDCNPAGFYKEAARRKIRWIPWTDKKDRKHATLEQFNTAMMQGKFYITEGLHAYEDELTMCSWSETDHSKIVHESKYHLADTGRIFVDWLPRIKPLEQVQELTYTQQLRQAWKQKQAAKEKAQQEKRAYIAQRRSRWTSRNRRRLA